MSGRRLTAAERAQIAADVAMENQMDLDCPQDDDVDAYDLAVFEREEIRLVLEQYPGATEQDARQILGWDA